MKTKKILETLALTAFSVGVATASPMPLQNASITATYNGSASGMLALGSGYLPGPTTLDPFNTSAEFFTSDNLFAIDFDSSGALTVMTMGAIPGGPHSMRFDFGASLANPISAFTLVDGSSLSAAPGLSILDAHTIELDLSALSWNGQFATMTAQIDAVAVPEPGSTTIVLAGLAGLALVRRTRKPRG